ncbi:unnamed protein product [Adineta steineri]|uniref:Uncharacterized protein n=1 Tax=Adineta steineri TaxID=433720 RepID=A0A819WUR9_9BILA|nr:unnamed protein product [Adineta steineri]
MATKKNTEYISGRGKPVYLVDRIRYESSIDSDYGVSRLFDTSSSSGTLSDYGVSRLFDTSSSSGTSSDYGVSRLFDTNSVDGSEQRTYATSELLNSSFMNNSSDIPVCLRKDEDYNANASCNDDYDSNVSFAHEDMFPPYRSIFPEEEDKLEQNSKLNIIEDEADSDSEETKVKSGQNTPPRVEVIVPDYTRCCMQACPKVDGCGETTRYHPDWPRYCVSFSELKDIDVRPLLQRYKVITRINEDDLIMNEKNLIANRLRLENILVDDSMFICPKHRSSYGLNWHVPETKCSHPDHDPQRHVSKSDLRAAKIDQCSKIEGFPVGGKVCSKHRKEKKMVLVEDMPASPMSTYSNVTNRSEFVIDNSRESVNQILTAMDLSPIRFQTKKKLEDYSDSTRRRMTSKLTGAVKKFEGMV